jgi:hypothetical protein
MSALKEILSVMTLPSMMSPISTCAEYPLRYKGETVIVTELEAKSDITYRWSLVGFGGSGWTAEYISDFGDESAKFAGGGGFRYLIARRLGLRVGLDVAVGPKDTVLYMGIGSAWD